MLDFYGTDYVTIDGRPGGSGSTSYLTFSNTSAAAASNRAVLIENNATNNMIQYCTLKAENNSTTAATAGVVYIGNGTNSSNTFSNNTITYASSTTACLLVSNNTTGTNATNVISTNNFADFTERGIWLGTGSDQWTINDNSIYRVVGITGGTTIGLIYIEAGDQYTINGNYLGGTAAYCGSGTFFTASNGSITGIYLAGSGSSASNIYGNYIKYFSVGSGTNVVTGIDIPFSSTTINIYENEIDNLKNAATSGNNATLYGIKSSGTSLTMNTYKNKVTNIYWVNGGSNCILYGCNLSQTSSTLMFYNNYVSVGNNQVAKTYTVKSASTTAYILNNTIEMLSSPGGAYDYHCLDLNTASTTNYLYNNILKSSGTSSNAYQNATIYKNSTATINHDNNYYQIPSITASTTNIYRTSNTGYSFTTWAETNGKWNTTLTLYSNGVVNANTTDVSGTGKNLYSANAVGSSIAITEDIVGKSRPNGAMWIGAYEGAGNIYYSTTSVANTDATITSNWKTGRNNTGSSPSNFTTAGDIFIVQPGHKYQVQSTAAFTGTSNGYITIEAGGALDINAQTMNGWQYLKLAGTGVLSSGIYSGSFYNSSSSAASISVPIILLSNATIISSGSGGLTLTGNITNGGFDLTIDGSNATTISTGVISGSGGLTKSGSGTLTLSGTNTYTGVTTINAGTVSVASIGDGGVASNLGQATSSVGNIVLGGGTLQFTGNTASTNRAFSLTATTTSTINVSTSGQSLTMSGNSGNSSSGALIKAGVGTLVLSGTNTYTGATTISAGTLTLGSTNAIANTSNLVINGGTLNTGASTGYSETMNTLNVSGSGTILLGSGNHTLNLAASNAVSWTANQTLTITNWGGTAGVSNTSGPKIIVGNSNSALTSNQLASISFTGYNCGTKILSSGEVVPNASPELSSSLTPTAICSGNTFTYTPTSATAGTTFTWTRASVVGISNAAESSAQSSNPSEALTNTTSAGVSVVYAYTLSANSCSNTQNVTVTVNPTPTITNSTTSSICSGGDPNISLTSSLASSYAWTLGTNTGSITGASASSGATISQTLTNPSNSASGSVEYVVTPTSTTGSCV